MGDFHICAAILGSQNLILLYFANFFGSVLSWIATFLTSVVYLVRKYRQRRLNIENPHHICFEAYQYFDISKLNQINGVSTPTNATPSTTPISIQKNHQQQKQPPQQQPTNINNNKNGEKEPLLANCIIYNNVNVNNNNNNNNNIINDTLASSTSTSFSSTSSNGTSSSYSYESPQIEQQKQPPFTESSVSCSSSCVSTLSLTTGAIVIPVKNRLKCSRHCLIYSDDPSHIQIREQKTNPKKIDTLIFYLSLADFIAVTSMIISQLIIILKSDIAKSIGFCVGERISIHFGLLATLFWSNCIAYYLLREVYEWKPYRITFKVFHIICWGMSFLGVASLFFTKTITITDTDNGGSWCSISNSYQLYIWVTCLFVSFSWNLICYILIYRKFNQILLFGIYGSRSTQLKRHIARKLSFYVLAFLITWVWDVLNHLIFIYQGKCPPFVLWFLQSLFSSGAGFLNVLVYVVTNKFFSFKTRR